MGNIGVTLSQYLPAPPKPGEDDQETIANLMKALREIISGIYEYDQTLATNAKLGFTSASDGTTTVDSNDGATLFLVSGEAITVAFATGQLVFKAASNQTDAEQLLTNINSNATTTIDANRIEILQYSTDITGGPPTNADNTAANNQPSAWLSTRVEAGEIRITAGGDTVLLENMLIDYANDWTDDNPSGLYLTTQFLGFFNTTSNTWPSVINNDGTFAFTIDASNEISHDGSTITVKAENGKIGSSTSFFDITNGNLTLQGPLHVPSDLVQIVEIDSASASDPIIEFRAKDTENSPFDEFSTMRLEDRNFTFMCNSDGLDDHDGGSTTGTFNVVVEDAAAASQLIRANGTHIAIGKLSGWNYEYTLATDDSQLKNCTLDSSNTIATGIVSKTGVYSGDGNATQGITGIGFQPTAVMVIPMNVNHTHLRTADMASTDSKNLATTADNPDAVRVLDADGFTVGDGTGGSNDHMNEYGSNNYM